MKKFILLAGFIAATILSAKAQDQAEPPSVQQEIGFGTNIILTPIFNRESIPLDFIYKRGNRNSLFRLGTSLAFLDNTQSSGNLMHINRQQELTSELFIGKEWRYQLAERWLLNYGADVNFNYYDHSFEVESKYSNEDKVTFQVDERTTYGAGIRPFFGAIFALNSRLLIGAEASFQTGLQRFFKESKFYTEESGQLNKENNYFLDEEADGWNLHFRTQPASNIFVYYRF